MLLAETRRSSAAGPRSVSGPGWQRPAKRPADRLAAVDGDGGNICAGSRRYGEPLWPAYYRHEGYIGAWFADPISLKTADGEDLTLYEFIWQNPEPAKKVSFVRLRGFGETDAGILLYKLKAAFRP